MRIFQFFVFIGILLFCLISVFVNPLYDDYLYSSYFLQYGFLESQIQIYRNWSGRYFSTILLTLNPLVWENYMLYKLFPIFLILLTLLSVFTLFDSLFRNTIDNRSKIFGAGVFTLTYLNGMPDILGGIYWFTGALSYQLANILTIFFLAITCRLYDDANVFKTKLIIAQCILIVLIVGSSETSMIFLLFIIGTITLINVWLRSNRTRDWLGFLLITVFCSYIVVSAPGNEIRESFHPERHQFFYSVGLALVQESRFFLNWITNPNFILLTILGIPFLEKLVEKNQILKNHFYVHPLIFIGWWWTLMFWGFFAPYWAMGELGQYRSVNVAYLFFLFGWFSVLISLISFLKKHSIVTDFRLPKFIYIIVIPLLVISLYKTNNTKQVVSNLVSGEAAKYNREMQDRFERFKSCVKQKETQCPINDIKSYPSSITHQNYFIPESFKYEKDFWHKITKENK